MCYVLFKMIIKELERFRAEHHLSNDDLAKMLNTHPVSWYRIKRTGKFSAKFLLNAQKILSPSATNGGSNATTEHHQTTLGQNLRRFGGRLRELVRRFFNTDISIGG